MSSSGSRGPPINRYNERSDYNDYNKARRKNFYNNTSRRDYKSNTLPGSSSLSHSKVPLKSENSLSSDSLYAPNRSRYNGGLNGSVGLSRRSYGGGPNVRDNRSSYGSYGMSKGAYNSYNSGQGSNSYYGSYNSYNNFSGPKRDPNDYHSGGSSNFYNRDDSWRSERVKSNGDSRLSTSTKPSLSNSSYGPRPNSSLKHSGPGSIDGDYRKDRYDSSYQGDSSLSSSGSKWKTPYGSNRSTLSGSVGSRNFSSKDRIRSYSGSSSLINGKKNDYYYSRNPYSSGNLYTKQVDHYNSGNKSRDFVRTKTYSEDDEGDEKQNSANEDENYSPSQYEDQNKSANFDDNSEMENENVKSSDDENQDNNVLISIDDNRIPAHEYEPENMDEDVEEEDDEDEEEEEVDNDDEIDQDKEEFKEAVINNTIAKNEDIKHQEKAEASKLETKEQINSVLVKRSEQILDGDDKMNAQLNNMDDICYPDGCIFPINSLESKFLELQKEFEHKTKSDDTEILKYVLAKPVKNFYDYPFYQNNFKSYFKVRSTIEDSFANKKQAIKKKKLSLWKSYSSLERNCEIEREKMDQQLRIVHPIDDEMRREIDSGDVKKQQVNDRPSYPGDVSPPINSNNRRNRRHGDLVTTEAEFQEILQTLGREDDENPLIRAERVAAKIPDYILDPIERNVAKFLDSNNLVVDKSQWSARVKYDFVDNFSESEHELFCEGFCLFPKRFGAISRHIGGLRTPNECVVHYYTTKKSVNYKQLLAQYRKRVSKKVGRRSKQVRSRNVSQNHTPVSTPATEKNIDEIDDFILNVGNTSFDSEEVFTDTGRRKRAAAPTFDTNVKKNEFMDDDSQRKKQKKKKEELIELPVTINHNSEKKEPTPTEEVVQDWNQQDLNNHVDPNDPDSKNRKKAISSYWSITETNSFPELLKEHGTKWTTIADKLTTKTATMVRNYYQRNAEKNGWNIIAENTDAKLDAKFAAVLGSKVDSKEYIAQQASPEESSDMSKPVAPVGTFQHPVATGDISLLNSTTDNKKSHIPSLKSFMTDNLSSITPPAIKKQVSPPQRTSIMSLLNSETSPVKSEPDNEITKQQSVTSKESLFRNILNSEPSSK